MSQFNLKQTRTFVIGVGLAIVLALCIYALYQFCKPTEESSVRVDSISASNHITTKVYHEAEPQKGLMIYIGDKSLGSLNAKYAQELAGLSYYVASVDSDVFYSALKNQNKCLNISDQLLQLSHQIQARYALSTEGQPILVGNASGANLVYAALAQQDSAHFYAGISINFLPTFNRPENQAATLCSLNEFQLSGAHIIPAKKLHASWYVFQDSSTAHNPVAEEFIYGVTNAKLTTSTGPANELNSEALQILQWLDPRLENQLSSSSGDSDLPVVEVEADSNAKDLFAVMLTGDGGWAEIDKNLADNLAAQSIPTVALDSLSYFWRKRTPEETAAAVDDLISSYGEKWSKHKVILVGFSFGAEVMPFIANRLSQENKNKVSLVALLSIGKTASFEFHLSNWMDADTSVDRMEVLPELKKMSWVNSVCIFGEEDEDNGCTEAAGTAVKLIPMSGDHHFDGHYELLAEHIVNSLNK